jgi:O-antigen/teichoic acid export membrane protein
MMVANYSAMALAMVTSFVLARLLGPSNLGMVYTSLALVDTVVQFLDIRSGEAMIRFIGGALARDERSEALTFLAVGLSADFALMAVSVLATLIAVPLASRLYPQPDVIGALAGIYIAAVPFATLYGSFSALAHIFRRWNLLAAAVMVIALARSGLLVWAASRGQVMVMWAFVWTEVFSFIVYILLGATLLFRHMGPPGGLRGGQVRRWLRAGLRGASYHAAWKQFIPFALHTSITASLKAIAVNVDVLLLGALRPPAEVAYFKIANSAANLITMPTAPVSNVIYPEMTEAWARRDSSRVRRLVRQFSILSLAISGACWAFLFLTADWLVAVFYSPEFIPAGNLIRVIGVGIVLESVFRWVRPLAMAQNRPQLVTFYGAASILLRLVLLIPFIFYLGSMGAALAYLVVVVFNILVIVFYVMPRLELWQPSGRRKES